MTSSSVGDGGRPESDPCAIDNGGCPRNATCYRSALGSSACECPSGFRFENKACRIIEAGPVRHLIGEICADSSAQSQSTCQRGLQCFPLTDSNYCTKECTTDADCGASGTFDNVCQPLGQGLSICLIGCDPSDRGTCMRPDLACYPLEDDSGLGMCLPACFSDDDCAYGTRCETSAGVCRRVECDANDACADPNDICDVREAGGQIVKSCVTRCSLQGCPAGRQCNATTDTCDPVIRSTYELCGQGVGECGASDSCVGFGDPGSLCLTNCASDSDCAAGGTCSVAMPNGGKLCVVTCGTAQQPDETVCPPETACAWFTDDGQTTLFCGPKS